jgi:signal transduction histidine kinase
MALRLPTPTARLRLTLLYAGLFLLLGTCVLGLVYGLVSRGSPIHVVASASRGVRPVPSAPDPPSVTVLPSPTGKPFVNPDPVGAQRDHDLARLLAVSWLALAVTSLAAGLLGWVAAGRVLRPLRAITDTARTISAGNLHQRLALAGPNDEFKRLGDTLDELLGRLQAAFDAQRRFVANASHELRTPLTVERTLLQVALADPDVNTAALRSTCEELLASGAEHERLLESLLTLATSERGLDRRELLDLATLTDEAVQAAWPMIASRSLQLESTLEQAPAAGDPALVRRLAANLIDNAIAHNLNGGRITVRTTTDDGGAILSVANSGARIAPDEVDLLFEPFHRRAESRAADTDGHHGLGLSIVRAIADAHGATLTAQAPANGGLAITVRFPAV